MSFPIFSALVFAENTGTKPDILSNSAYTFVFGLISLLVLYWVLKKILWKPVTKFMEDRTANIQNEIEKADQKNIEADALKEQYQLSLTNVQKESIDIIEQARQKAQIQSQEIMNAAVKEAEAYKANAREDMIKERDALLASLHNEITSLALAAASKVIEENMDFEKNRKLVNAIIAEEV